MAITKQISIRLKEEVLVEIDAEAESLGVSRNLIISRRVEKLPPLYGVDRATGEVSEIKPGGWMRSSVPEKLEDKFRGMGKCPHGYVNWMICKNAAGGCE